MNTVPCRINNFQALVSLNFIAERVLMASNFLLFPPSCTDRLNSHTCISEVPKPAHYHHYTCQPHDQCMQFSELSGVQG